MKHLIILAILLTGQFSAFHQAIADKYAFFYRDPIVIRMTNKPGYANGKENCGLNRKIWTALGCTYTLKNGTPYYMELSNDLKWKNRFERDMLHEIGHYQLRITDEKKADTYADLMIKFRNSL